MSGLFGTLGTATSGLNANQVALQTTSHNLANVNTDGYSRQRVQMETTYPYKVSGVGFIGTGVRADTIERVTDQFIVGQVRAANSSYQAQAQIEDTLGQLDVIFNEPSDTGLLKQIDVLNDSWNKLAEHPELQASKTMVLENAQSFVDTLHDISRQSEQLASDTTDSIAKGVIDLNQKLSSLETVNKQIFILADQNETPNDLLDMRDSLLKDLSSLAPIEASFDRYGRASVKIDGQTVLDESSRQTINVVVGSENGQATIANGGDQSNQETTTLTGLKTGTLLIGEQAIAVKTGVIGGLQTAKDEIDTRLDELDQVADMIARSTNLIYTNGESETSGFYELSATGRASQTLTVNPDLIKDPSTLQAGKTADAAAGDGSKALAIARLATTKLGTADTLASSFDASTLSFKNDPKGLTNADRYNTLVTKNAIATQQATQRAKAQLSVLNQLEYKQQSISGVSMNEEMSDVIRFQQGFQANARVLSTISEMLDTLINRTGV